MKFVFLIAFLVFSPHVAGAGNNCPDPGKDFEAWWQCRDKALSAVLNKVLKADPHTCGDYYSKGKPPKTEADWALRALHIKILGVASELSRAGLLHSSGDQISQVEKRIGEMDYDGGYVSPEMWNMLEDKEVVATMLAIYRDCILGWKERWATDMKFYDAYTGKEIGRLSPGSGYKDKAK